MRKLFVPVLLVSVVLAVSWQGTLAQDIDPDTRVFTRAELLARGDVLTDGPEGKEIPITDATLLVWVDLQPGWRFVHDSSYVLISADEVRVLPGQWWPVVNGRSAFGTPPWFPETDEVVRFPIAVPNEVEEAARAGDEAEEILVYADAYALRRGDTLEDPAWIWPLRIDDQTLLFWIDLHPRMKFEHETIYLLIGPDGVSRAEGLWWPTLNGRQILYGEDNDWGVQSAFDLFFQ